MQAQYCMDRQLLGLLRIVHGVEALIGLAGLSAGLVARLDVDASSFGRSFYFVPDTFLA